MDKKSMQVLVHLRVSKCEFNIDSENKEREQSESIKSEIVTTAILVTHQFTIKINSKVM